MMIDQERLVALKVRGRRHCRCDGRVSCFWEQYPAAAYFKLSGDMKEIDVFTMRSSWSWFRNPKRKGGEKEKEKTCDDVGFRDDA